MPKKRKAKYAVATLDFETDPFLYGRVPSPFCVGLRTGTDYYWFWGGDCVYQLVDFLRDYPEPLLIYAHNGGKFDFHFLFDYIDNPALIIKQRIVECRLLQHKLRDSFAILPVPLRDYSKIDFDYNKMERHCREQHKDEILYYLKDDCDKLYDLVAAFVTRFGPKMTIGGTAMSEIQKLHPFIKQGSEHDKTFRPFYYGGRVQCFRSGIIPGPWKMIDVNSMYPSVMRNKRHPVNGSWDITTKLPDTFDDPYFVVFDGKNRGALPSKSEDGSLIFTQSEGTFHACSHEIEVALKWGLIDIEHIHVCYVAAQSTSFAAYVDKFYAEKSASKASGDKTGEIFAKLLLNSGYGRFGMNPDNFEDWYINRDFGNDDELEGEGYGLSVDYDNLELWSRKTEIDENNYCDVSVAASITSAARAVLLEGLQLSDNPIYCDTDSIVARDFQGDIDPYRLGAWDLEKTGTHMAIAGKKMYCLFDRDAAGSDTKVKLSSKGGTLSMAEIQAICRGSRVRYENAAPTFSLNRAPTFIHRNFTKTVDLDEIAE